MQRTRAIPVAWLNSGLCPDQTKGWIPVIIIIIIIIIIPLCCNKYRCVTRHNYTSFLFKHCFYIRVINALLLWFGLFLSVKHATKINSKQTIKQKYLYKCPTYPTWNNKTKANLIGHILRRNCLLKQVIEGKIKGEMEVTRRRGRRRKKLLDDLRTGEDTLIWRRNLWIALCRGIVLEEALDLSSDRILNERMKCLPLVAT